MVLLKAGTRTLRKVNLVDLVSLFKIVGSNPSTNEILLEDFVAISSIFPHIVNELFQIVGSRDFEVHCDFQYNLVLLLSFKYSYNEDWASLNVVSLKAVLAPLV